MENKNNFFFKGVRNLILGASLAAGPTESMAAQPGQTMQLGNKDYTASREHFPEAYEISDRCVERINEIIRLKDRLEERIKIYESFIAGYPKEGYASKIKQIRQILSEDIPNISSMTREDAERIINARRDLLNQVEGELASLRKTFTLLPGGQSIEGLSRDKIYSLPQEFSLLVDDYNTLLKLISSYPEHRRSHAEDRYREALLSVAEGIFKTITSMQADYNNPTGIQGELLLCFDLQSFNGFPDIQSANELVMIDGGPEVAAQQRKLIEMLIEISSKN